MSIYHLNHTDGHWILTGAAEPGPLARFITRPEAVLHSSQLARETGGSLQIHGQDGDVEEVRSYRSPHCRGEVPATFGSSPNPFLSPQ
ncbi:MAG TPA: DUF2188 domain-containing protein [Verrucomicrobiales bacterium]|jgi:hypothetical protein|nr:DUF2188 domain-containing protein [Verrucomicrobiales bacterium]